MVTFILSLVLPILMALTGLWLEHAVAAGKSDFLRYRSDFALKNADTRRFAQLYCGQMWRLFGVLTAVVTGALLWLFGDGNLSPLAQIIVWCLQGLVWLGATQLTELALKRVFLPDGSRKEDSIDE